MHHGICDIVVLYRKNITGCWGCFLGTICTKKTHINLSGHIYIHMTNEMDDVEAPPPEASMVQEPIMVENATIYSSEIDHIPPLASTFHWKPPYHRGRYHHLQTVVHTAMCMCISNYFLCLGIGFIIFIVFKALYG